MIPLFTSSCWDYMEIEKRGYVLGIAIDKAETKNLDTKNFQYMQLETNGSLYAYSIQVPIVARSQHRPSGQSGGAPDTSRDWNLTVVSNAFFEANRQYATILDYPPHYAHLQAIVISEAAAKEDISRLIDMFVRDPEMRRRTKVFITPGRAIEVLNVIPRIDDYSSQYLRTLPNNAKKTSRMAHRTDLGRVSGAIHSKRNYILPRVIANEYEIKDVGMAVFKDNKMIGWLDELKSNYLKWISGYAQGGTVSINVPNTKDDVIVLEMRKIKTKQRPIVKGDSISMSLDIKVNMNIGEFVTPKFYNTDDPKFIASVEKLAEQHIKKQIESSITYVQNKYGADIFFFDQSMKRYAPKTWAKVKNNWDDIFETLKVDVKVKVKINQIGLIR